MSFVNIFFQDFCTFSLKSSNILHLESVIFNIGFTLFLIQLFAKIEYAVANSIGVISTVQRAIGA
jgi:hypothetical protein